jgi:hypothetical protein
MRLYAALSLALAACAPDSLSTPDAATDDTPAAADVAAPDAGPDAAPPPSDIPCGGLCGRGTVCTLNRCVAVPTEDAGGDVVDAEADVAVDVARDAPLVCPSGRGDCDHDVTNGCEENLNADLRNCGACGRECVSRPGTNLNCVSGECVSACTSGLGDCDMVATNGCETMLNTAANCGACGRSCAVPHANVSCSTTLAEPTCLLVSCMSGHSDCDRDAANGCECVGPCSGRSCLN